MTVVLLLVAGAVGAVARYEMSGWVQRRARSTRPWGTAAVNLGGALVLGVLVVARSRDVIGDDVMLVVGTGWCGAFTTFSTWMVESVHAAEEGGRAGRRTGFMNVVGPLVAGSCLTLALLMLAA